MGSRKKCRACYTNFHFKLKIDDSSVTFLIKHKYLSPRALVSSARGVSNKLSRLKTLLVQFLFIHAIALFYVSDISITHAETTDNNKENKFAKAATKKRYAVRQQCAKKLERIQADLEQEKWGQARTALLQSLDKSCTSSYEKSQVWNFLAYTYYSQDNYAEAIKAYKKVIAEPQTDERLKNSVYYSVAQLYFVSENYVNAAKYLEQWLKHATVVSADGKALLAQSYYQLNRKKDALKYIGEAIMDYEAKGSVPKENWWSLQRVIYYERKAFRNVISVLKKLIKHYPKYTYWRQLGGMYGEINQDINQLISSEVIYLAGGMSKERELLGLAYLFMGADSPYLAAKVVENGMSEGRIERSSKNMEFLGQAWQQAHEGLKARPVLEKAAALSDKGTIWARLARVYFDVGDDQKAIRASRNAIRKGGIKRKDLTYVVLGNAHLNLHCYDDAIDAFAEAAKDKRSSVYAKRLIDYAKREGVRRQKLRDMGAAIPGCANRA